MAVVALFLMQRNSQCCRSDAAETKLVDIEFNPGLGGAIVTSHTELAAGGTSNGKADTQRSVGG